MFVQGSRTTAEMAGGICAQVCQGGQQIWAGIASSKALVETMVTEAITCLGDLVSILLKVN